MLSYLFLVAMGKFSLEDHIVVELPKNADAEWKRLDCTMFQWVYESISSEILDIVMEAATTAHAT